MFNPWDTTDARDYPVAVVVAVFAFGCILWPLAKIHDALCGWAETV